ncbi:C40 family peptidase [Lysobacter sp. SG-8]|uniref:C40 family peptidase n=1 Tax=Marilutibacter penaei TaxID=2759900 RepID=A0A7W3U6C9_9GAMM|nr:C40 family peptidase [Lysobacter penaei]
MRRTRLLQRLSASALLALLALPALAQQLPSPSLAADSADAPSAVTSTMLPDAMGMSDRALLLANDLNRLMGQPSATDEDLQVEDRSGRTGAVLRKALALLGTPYRWGGTSPESGFDCSGLVGYVFRNALGIELPRVSREMARNGEEVKDQQEMVAGDLVFFGRRGRVDHVGIYLGEGRFVHAPRTGRTVSVSRLDSGYWANKFMEARRVEGI